MTLIKLTHANNKQTMYVVRDLIAGHYHSPGHVCTHVVMSGGAVFPAQESSAEINRLLEATAPTANNASKEEENGKRQTTDVQVNKQGREQVRRKRSGGQNPASNDPGAGSGTDG